MSTKTIINDRASTEEAYLSLLPEQKAVVTWMLKELSFKLRGYRKRGDGHRLWVFDAPGKHAKPDEVEVAEEELRWRHMFGIASSYDYALGLTLRDIFHDYVTAHGGTL